MRQRVRVFPYKQGSRSAKALSEALEGRVLKLEGSRFRSRQGDVIINWGSSNEALLDSYGEQRAELNDPILVSSVSNKLTWFSSMKEHGLEDIIPAFWTNREDIPDEAFPVVCRTVLNGHSGRGIVISDTPDDLVEAALYVKYIKKKEEYRIHCGVNRDGTKTVIAAQRKARREDCDEPNWQVRNHSNGFVFVRGDVDPHPSCTEVALQALSASGLDFGAVDVIWNEHQQRAYVLEINTAPGLEGQTVQDYAQFFTQWKE